MTKTIENKETAIPFTEEVKLNYATLLAIIINKPVKEGITLKQMKSDLAILHKLDTAEVGDLIEFDEDQVKTIKAATESHPFVFRHDDLDAFGDYIDAL